MHDSSTVIYRPATLVLGIGCRRGVSFADLERFVLTVLQEHGLSGKSVVTLATADIKGDEILFLNAGAALWLDPGDAVLCKRCGRSRIFLLHLPVYNV